MDQWKAILGPRLGNDSLAQDLAGRITSSELVEQSVQKFCSDHKDIKDAQVKQLLLVLDIYEVSKGGMELLKYILANTAMNTLADVAKTYYVIEKFSDAPSHDAKVNDDFRSELFKRAPTAVLCGLVQSGFITTDTAGVETEAAAFLERALSRGFDIGRKRISPILASDKLVEKLSDSQRKSLHSFVEAIQRLQVLVHDARHIQNLLKLGVVSAHDIASMSDFLNKSKAQGLDQDSASAILNQALAIDRRNEQAWADYVLSRKALPVLAVDDTTPSEESNDAIAVSMANLFGDMDAVECDEFSSILSPAGYLVDLLQLLRYASVDTKDPNASVLLDEFFRRRPDIQNLQLSKSNTVNLVRYADLVNEVLESYISFTILASGEFQVYNEDSSDEPGSTYSAMANTNWAVYENVIQSQVFPIALFPFNLGIATMRECLKAVGSSRYEVLCLFSFKDSLKMDYFDSDGELQSNILESALNRRLAAEYLGLTHDDFIVITREAFQSLPFIRAMKGPPVAVTQEDYQGYIGLKSAGEYWGYVSDKDGNASDKMAGTITNINGLANIKEELLPRAQLTLEELLTILKTDFVGRKFIITVQNASGEYSEKLEDMRLQHSPLYRASSGTALSVDACFNLQAFLRLWRRLGWPIADLDAAIISFESARLSGSKAAPEITIGPETIEDLAAAKRLSDLSTTDVQLLLPLWADMQATGYGSLYRRFFGKKSLVKQYPGLDITAKVLPVPSMSDNLAPLLAAFKLSEAAFRAISSVSGIAPDDPWTLQNVSKIYRVNLLCQLFQIDPNRCQEWILAMPMALEAFTSPQAALKLLKQWQALNSAEWQLDLVLTVLKPAETQNDISSDNVSMVASLLSVLNQIEVKYDGLKETGGSADPQNFTAEILTDVCSSLFGSSVGGNISQVIEGTSLLSTQYQSTGPISVPADLSTKVSYSSPSLCLRGLLTSKEREELVAAGSKDPQWVSAVEDIYSKSQQLYTPLATALSKEMLSKISPLFLPKVTSDPNSVEAEAEFCTRRKLFVQAVLPALTQSLVETAIKASIASLLPSLDRSIMTSLLQDKTMPIGGTSGSGLEALQLMLQKNKDQISANQQNFDGYFVAPATGTYTFITDNSQKSTLQLAGKSLGLDGSEAVPLIQGNCYSLSFKGESVQSVKFLTTNTLPSQVSALTLVARAVGLEVNNMMTRLKTASAALDQAKLSLDEFLYFHSRNLDFSKPTWADLMSFLSYTRARKLFTGRGTQTLLQLCQWVSNMAGNTGMAGTLSDQISQTTGWQTKRIEELLGMVYPSLADAERASAFLDCQNILLLADVLDVSDKTGVPTSTLLEWSRLRLPQEITADFASAKSFHSLLEANATTQIAQADEALAAKKKEALIGFLLAQESVKALSIYDADGLFEYFLIDVQMGPQQQTSRIKQAISTVQLFIQRCMLGLEKARGIPTTAIDQKKWTWMCKFTLWQANRKIFLYPENWAEPTLRDDKSDAFKAIEATILQSNLNLESIGDIVRQYIYACNEVADLDIQTYLWEGSGGFHGTYHFFSRTRTAPYKYYYRSLEVTGIHPDDPTYNWYPWVKLDINVPPQEVNYDGKGLDKSGTYMVPSLYRGRLFLFVPQVSLKTRSKTYGSDESPETFAKTKGNLATPATDKLWEIKIGWTEYRNGVWSKNEVSTTGFEIQGLDPGSRIPAEATKMPDISSFRFWVRGRSPSDLSADEQKASGQDEILMIDVLRWFQPADSNVSQQHYLGRFELRGTQMIAIESQQDPPTFTQTLPTKFSKLNHSTTAVKSRDLETEVSKYLEHDSADSTTEAKQPLFAIVPSLSPFEKNLSQNVTWTISYNSAQYQGASALIVERVTGSRVESYFGFPVLDLSGNLAAGVSTTSLLQRLTHDIAQPLMEKATTSTDLQSIYDVVETVPKAMSDDAFGAIGIGLSRELAAPNSIYNWELGFHIILLLMERLLSTQQFDLGLQIGNFVFDPRADDREIQAKKGLFIPAADSNAAPANNNTTPPKSLPSAKKASSKAKPLSNLERCWHFPPFKSAKLRAAGSMKAVIQQLKPGRDQSEDIMNWIANPFDPHAIARGRPAIYMKRFVMKYIALLIASGDEYFRQNSLESIPMALQRYVEASHLFGNVPQVLPRPTKPVIKTYKDIFPSLTDFASADVDLELTFPFFVDPAARVVKVANASQYDGVLGMVRSTYFPVPSNPQLVELRSQLDDRFYKIRNSLDINGDFRQLPLFDPPLDPGQLVRGVAAGGLSALSSAIDGPMPNYRFLYLLQKAFELCSELRSLGDAYLSVKEKKDAEGLSALRAKQDVSMQLLLFDVKQMQKNDALKTIEVLQDTRKAHVMRLTYYLALIGEKSKAVPTADSQWDDIQQSIDPPIVKDQKSTGNQSKEELVMSPQESLEMSKFDDAADANNKASALENASAILVALPNMTENSEPMGIGASIKYDAANVAQGMMLVAGVMRYAAQQSMDDAGRASRKGQLIRQLQERRLQANIAGRDIKNVDLQLESQNIKVSICDAEIKNQQQQIANMAEVEERLRTKYTNESLYAWMDASLRQIFYQTYLLTVDLAKSAEKAFLFERGPLAAAENYLATSYWDNARDGAFSAQNLYLGLKRIENAYYKRKAHDFEVTKFISLRQVDPWALLRLQESGRAEFSLPEVLFDFDFPGHYCRRIKSVAVTIPCIVGPYTGICCTLKLLEHCYRLRQSSAPSDTYYPDSINTDSRYRTDRIPISSIAISSGQQDSGLFEMNFQGERYGPFEGAGAISHWLLELPTVRQFDYRYISDVILKVNYTSLDGGATWRKDASDAALAFQKKVQEGNSTISLFELGNAAFGQATETATGVSFTIKQIATQLPFWTMGKSVVFKKAWVAASKDLKLDATATVNQNPLKASSQKVGDFIVMETDDGEYSWTDLQFTVPNVKLKDTLEQRIWLLLSFVIS